jgi:hypothetical protein
MHMSDVVVSDTRRDKGSETFDLKELTTIGTANVNSDDMAAREPGSTDTSSK